MSTRNKELIQAAIEGFEAKKRRINEQIMQLTGMLTGASSEVVSVSPSNGRRTMSAAARKRIADATHKRWAAVKKGAEPKAAVPAPKKAKRRLSPEGRRRIIEATKKRWAAFRAAAVKARK
jgi:hypothetical protein